MIANNEQLFPRRASVWVCRMAAASFASAMLPALAVASEGAGHGETSLITQLTWPTINFVVLVLILNWVYRKKVATLLVARSERIAAHIERSGILVQEAEQKLREVELQLSQIAEQQTKLLEQYRAEGARIADSVLVRAKEEAEKTMADAARQIDREIERAKAELEHEVLQRSLRLVRNRIQGELTDEQDRQLREQVLRQGLLQ